MTRAEVAPPVQSASSQKADESFAESVTSAAAAHVDFNELWTTGRAKPGGTLERDRNIFVLGAVYGLAWAMENIVYGPAGEIELVDQA